MKIIYLATYTTILKKADGDYCRGVKDTYMYVAGESRANNSHHASYSSPGGRAIVLNEDLEYKSEGPGWKRKSWRAGNTKNGEHKEAFY